MFMCSGKSALRMHISRCRFFSRPWPPEERVDDGDNEYQVSAKESRHG